MNLPDWFSHGVNAQPSNGGMGTSAMFDKPTPEQQGQSPLELLKNTKLAQLLMQAVAGTHPNPQEQTTNALAPQQYDHNANFMPPQTPQISPNMGQVNPYGAMSPNGQPMPNWNQQ
jgi:hypothetical protein